MRSKASFSTCRAADLSSSLCGICTPEVTKVTILGLIGVLRVKCLAVLWSRIVTACHLLYRKMSRFFAGYSSIMQRYGMTSTTADYLDNMNWRLQTASCWCYGVDVSPFWNWGCDCPTGNREEGETSRPCKNTVNHLHYSSSNQRLNSPQQQTTFYLWRANVSHDSPGTWFHHLIVVRSIHLALHL